MSEPNASPIDDHVEAAKHSPSPVGAQPKLEAHDYAPRQNRFPRLSRPVELIRHIYDVVVIGSGYGGGVAASRMARAGQGVCVLERGKERWPGEYPSNLKEAVPEVSVSGLFAPRDTSGKQISIGDPTRLYQLVVGQDQNAFVASGLGGTSLLNANVFLKADSGTMSLPEWPEDLREPGALDPYYERAADMLQPEAYPDNFPRLKKLDVLETQAKALGMGAKFYRVPQTTRFHTGPNSVGVQMQASSLTGMDSTGVNDGSKSSTLVNYIADAWNHGAEIFCETEVRYIRKHPTDDGYLVFYAWYGGKRGRFKNNIHHDLMWVHAKKLLFLGAGTLGTTEILLRSKALGMKMSDRIGKHISGNGDILAFGYNTDTEVNGMGRTYPLPDKPVGPTITGVIDCREQDNPLDGYVIQEGAITQPLVPVIQTVLESLPGKILPTNYGLAQRLKRFLSRQRSRISHYSASGSLEHTQTYNQGIMTLEKGKTALRWEGVGRADHVRELDDLLAKMTQAIGGTYINSPFYAKFGQQEITVHPIGGVSISRDGTGENGAVDSVGRVFKGTGTQVYDGLIVVDGSAVPTALGCNPFATITALAERSVEAAAERLGISINYDMRNATIDLFARPMMEQEAPEELQIAEKEVKRAMDQDSEGIEFTEVMSGYIMTGEDNIEDFEVATDAATSAGSTARIFLSCHAWSPDDFSHHPAMLIGSFVCASLPGSPFNVLRGKFSLFNRDRTTPDTTNLTYDFDMISTRGEIIHFHGYKIVDRSIAFDPAATWRATSTLYVTLTKDETTVGKGTLIITKPDFLDELETFHALGKNKVSRLASAGSFLGFFSAQLFDKFAGPFAPMQYPSLATFGAFETNKRPADAILKITADDGVMSTLVHWLPTGRFLAAKKVLFVPGASVDHQIFALPTIQTNAVEHFQAAGFEVYCVVHRVGMTPEAQKNWTAYDARLDIKAAFEAIHKSQDSDGPIYVVAHCAGSVALSCGLLDGTIPTRWLRALTASQVFFAPVFGLVNNIVARLPVSPTTLYRLVAGKWFSSISTKHDSFLQRLFNQLLRLYPVGSRKEICNSVVCHRLDLVFGRLWSHDQLNDATHSNLDKFLGGVSMDALDHLMDMGRKHVVCDNERNGLVTEANLQRLKGLRILFVAGSENVVYSPESQDRAFSKLTDLFGQDGYDYEVIDGYGHLDCWMGKNAVEDVYPLVLRHAQRA